VDVQENYIEDGVEIILQGLPYMVGPANGSLAKYAMVICKPNASLYSFTQLCLHVL
jgi:hypothetical protein